MRFPATCRSSTSNNIPIELTIIDVLIDINCLKNKTIELTSIDNIIDINCLLK